jgi:hypothetical protein
MHLIENNLAAAARDATEPSRVMVVGESVEVVQQVSRFCLTQGTDVLPFYGLPDEAAIALFDPHVVVLCLPLAASFLTQIDRPYLLWQQPELSDLTGLSNLTAVAPTAISNPIALVMQLQAVLN